MDVLRYRSVRVSQLLNRSTLFVIDGLIAFSLAPASERQLAPPDPTRVLLDLEAAQVSRVSNVVALKAFERIWEPSMVVEHH